MRLQESMLAIMPWVGKTMTAPIVEFKVIRMLDACKVTILKWVHTQEIDCYSWRFRLVDWDLNLWFL